MANPLVCPFRSLGERPDFAPVLASGDESDKESEPRESPASKRAQVSGDRCTQPTNRAPSRCAASKA
jgi:hypothetical protein